MEGNFKYWKWVIELFSVAQNVSEVHQISPGLNNIRLNPTFIYVGFFKKNWTLLYNKLFRNQYFYQNSYQTNTENK